jgi:hypothetical protein
MPLAYNFACFVFPGLVADKFVTQREELSLQRKSVTV